MRQITFLRGVLSPLALNLREIIFASHLIYQWRLCPDYGEAGAGRNVLANFIRMQINVVIFSLYPLSEIEYGCEARFSIFHSQRMRQTRMRSCAAAPHQHLRMENIKLNARGKSSSFVYS